MVDDAIAGALDGYRIDGELGRGAMGEVYGGRHLRLGRDVAIKRLPAGFAADPAVRTRFGAEAQVLASLDHPHIVPVYDYVEQEDLCLLVMQALPGGTVWELFRSRGMTMATACATALATCAGLSHAHQRKVLHRDVKPENLMFDDQRTLKVTDFGIATVIGGNGTLATAGGEIVGTPAYMAPEQADGSAVGPAADVYAVATMLYELLSGRLPFDERGTPMDLLRRRLNEAPLPLTEASPAVPRPIADAVMAGLARRPGDRPGSADEMGILVGRAAVAAWGPTWLERADVQLLAGGALVAAATSAVAPSAPSAAEPTQADRPPSGPSTRDTLDRDAAGVEPRQIDRTVVGRSDGDTSGDRSDPDSPASVAPSSAAPSADEVVVAPATAGHDQGADLSDLSPQDMVPVATAPGLPPVPWVAAGIAILLAAATVLVGLTGLGAEDPTVSDLQPGAVVLAGADAATIRPVPVDLGQPIPVVLGAAPPDGTAVQLQFSVAGLPLGSSDQEPLVEVPGGRGATVSASAPRIVASGPIIADVVVIRADGSEASTSAVEVQPDRSLLLSAAGWVTILLGAGVAALAWSLAAPLRRGRRRLRSMIGLTLLGALAGVVAVLLGWCLGGPPPSPGGLVPAAVLGAGAFAAGSVAVLGWGRRRRIRRRRKARARAKARVAR